MDLLPLYHLNKENSERQNSKQILFFLVENRHQCDLVQGQGLRFLKISAIYFNVEGLGLRDNKETSQLYGLFAIFEKP